MSNQTIKSSELTLDEAIKWAQEWQESSELAIPAEIVTGLVDGALELKGRNATQGESITHLQSQFRVMKEAIEAALTWIEKFKTLDHNAFHVANKGFEWEKCNERRCQKATALVSQLRSAISPKGSEQKP